MFSSSAGTALYTMFWGPGRKHLRISCCSSPNSPVQQSPEMLKEEKDFIIIQYTETLFKNADYGQNTHSFKNTLKGTVSREFFFN